MRPFRYSPCGKRVTEVSTGVNSACPKPMPESISKEKNKYFGFHPQPERWGLPADKLNFTKKRDVAYLQYSKDHIEEIRGQEKWLEEESIRLDERRKTLKELQDIIKKAKELKWRMPQTSKN